MNEHDEELIDRLLDERDPRSAPAGSPLARARMKAHKAFDRLWQDGSMSRSQAYKWLARSMGISRERCHMIMFTEGDCAEVVRLCSLEALSREKD